MPSWTLGDLMSMATARAGHRADISASTVSFWVNQAISEVWLSAPQAELEALVVSSTTSGNGRITLPSDHYETITLSYLSGFDETSARTLRRMSELQIDSRLTAWGPPREYVEYSTWLELYPSPNSAWSLQLRYRARPSDLTNTAAVPSLATEWRLPVLHLAEAYIHEYIGNVTEAAYARTRYAGTVAALKDANARRQTAQGGMRASLPLRRSRY